MFHPEQLSTSYLFVLLFERCLKFVNKGLLLKGLISKRKQLQIIELCLLPQKPNNFTYRLHVTAKIKAKVCNEGETHSRSFGQCGQWKEVQVYPKRLRTSPLLSLPIQSISGLLGRSSDSMNSQWDPSISKNWGGEPPLKVMGAILNRKNECHFSEMLQISLVQVKHPHQDHRTNK